MKGLRRDDAWTMALKKKTQDARAINAFAELRRNKYGRDSWMAFKEARLIVRAHLGNISLVCQVLAIESVSKSSSCKRITGNTEEIKGGSSRLPNRKGRDRFTDEEKKLIGPFLPPVPSERAKWMQSELLLEACLALPHRHQGEIIAEVQSICKATRRNVSGVYFIRDDLRPDEYNIGRTSRSAEKRLKDAGSKGRHWKIVAFLENAIENDIHKLLRKWKSTSGRGSETFILDQEARGLLKTNYNVSLP